MIWLFIFFAQARVFDLNKTSVSTYLRGAYGLSNAGVAAYDSNSADTVEFSKSSSSSTGGEFGVAITGKKINLRLGVEIIRPGLVEEAMATSGASEVYTVTSETSILTPKAVFEFNFKLRSEWRFFGFLGFGYSQVGVLNSYTFSQAGQAQYLLTDFSEELRGTALSYEGGLGIEVLLSDSTTVALEAGYRRLEFNQLSHNKEITGWSGATAKGDEALKADGSKRVINYSSPTVALALRFYFF
jgi:hypothetical protein